MIDPYDYWVNNPLITPINKALMYDNAIWMAKMDMKDDIKDIIEFEISEYLGHDGSCDCKTRAETLQWLLDKISGNLEDAS